MKTGIHANTTRDATKLIQYYQRSKAKVVKVMEFDPQTLAALRAMGVTVIGRVYESEQRLGNDGRDFLNKLITYAREYPWILWEGFNEAFQEGRELEQYAEFEIQRMKRLEAVGAKAIIGNFSLGRPNLEDWPLFRPALDYAMTHGHALGKHEYAGPFMQWLCGENQWNWTNEEAREAAQLGPGVLVDPVAEAWRRLAATEGAGLHPRSAALLPQVLSGHPTRIDDPCLSPTVEGWLCLRYRKDYRIFKEWGLGDLPLYITEGGIDDCQPRPGPQGRGWQDFADTEWARIPGIGDYAQQRRWYMWQISHDPYAREAMDFGWDDVTDDWTSFRLDNAPAMLNRVIAAESDLPVGHFADMPTPTPSPAPAPVPPTPTPSPDGVFAAIMPHDGEGWISVAKRAGVTAAALKAANGGGTGPKRGQVLKVPGFTLVKDRAP